MTAPASVTAALRELGYRECRGASWAPCPVCGAERRSAHDARGPVVVRAGDTYWWCHHGHGGGVRALYDRAERPVPALPSASGVAPAPGDRWPDRWEVADLWERARVVRHPVVSWLRSRSLDHERLLEDRAVGCLPGGPLPAWAEHWRYLGEAALLPLYDRQGEVRCLHARRVDRAVGRAKSIGAKGEGVRAGLVYATPAGLDALRGAPGRLVVAEGEPDYLTHAQRRVAVVGIPGPGAWTPQHGAGIRAHVLIRTHDDDAGHGYADRIVASLPPGTTWQRRERT